MTFTPYRYQEKAIVKLISQAHAGLFLDPGLGKTVIALSAFKILKDKGLVDKMYVVAPLLVMHNSWPREFSKWLHLNELTYSIVHGKDKEDRLNDDVDIYLINPEAVPWLLDPAAPLFRLNNAMQTRNVLCIDESTRFKSPASKRFKALRKWLYVFERRWILTGTPVPHSLQDLFSQIYLLDEGNALGRYITHFRTMYMNQPNPYEKYKWVFNEGAIEEITDRVAPLVVHMKAEDYIEMPELMFNDKFIELDDSSRAKYNEVEDEFFTLVENEAIVAANAGVAGGKCRQIANGAVYLEGGKEWVEVHKHKLGVLESLLEELGDQPKIILYEFRHDLERIQKEFGPFPVLSGKNINQAIALINEFNKGGIPAIIGHPASMGHGLNIQAKCHHEIWFGITWNFEHYDQAIRRIFRQGQPSDWVMIHRIIARDTRDQTVASTLLSREVSQKDIMSAVVKRQSLLY